LFLAYFLLRILAPKISAIALVTAKEVMSQPLFYVVLAIGGVALAAFIIVPYYTFGEDVKMLKDSGLTLILVLAILVAVWSASVSISDEIEGRTALTLLSKPVRRRQFILGKFVGILQPTLLLFIFLGTIFLVTVSLKVVYDAREVAQPEPTWQACYVEVVKILPGLVLAFLEAVVLAAISVALSTRLPMVANLIVCFSIYVLGHLVPLLVASSVGKFEIVRFVGMFLATILPVLDHFNIQAAVAAGVDVPTPYLGLALLYCVLYSSIAMLAALAMFEDRDLA
jgi:ABC-type transport system involved in multi-copper enzyme maturation permease subunit